MSKYIGKRVVPKHCGEWSKDAIYEMNSIVYAPEMGRSFMARREVPQGVSLDNIEYWAVCADFSGQLAGYQNETDKKLDTYQQNMDEKLTEFEFKVEADVRQMDEDLAYAEGAMQDNRRAMEDAVSIMNARLDANVSASTEKNADYAAELVDARVDSDGVTYPTAGAAIRALSESLPHRIMPTHCGSAVADSSGNTVSVRIEDRTVVADFSYVGNSYVGIFAQFYGPYEDIQDKKIRVVVRTDREVPFVAILTNANNAWGSSDGTVKSINLKRFVSSEENHFLTFIDVDFSSELVRNYVETLDENRRTLRFALRLEQTGVMISDCKAYLYAYDMDDTLNLFSKFALGQDEFVALLREVEAARNDGNAYSSLPDVMKVHGDTSREVMEARQTRWGFAYDSLAGRLSALDLVVKPTVPINYVSPIRDNTNGSLNEEGKIVSSRTGDNSAEFIFDFETYDSKSKQEWGSVHFSFSMAAETAKSLLEKEAPGVELYVTSADGNTDIRKGDTFQLSYYINGYLNWGNTLNRPGSAVITVGSKVLIPITREQLINVVEAERPLYFVFQGASLNNVVLRDIGKIRIVGSFVAGDTEDLSVGEGIGYRRYADRAYYADTADFAAKSDAAGRAEYASMADNFFLYSPDNLLNVEGKRYSFGMDTTEIPQKYPYAKMHANFQTPMKGETSSEGGEFSPILHLKMTLGNASPQISNQGYVKFLDGMLSFADMLQKFQEGYKRLYICELEDYSDAPEGMEMGSYNQRMLISFYDPENVFHTAINMGRVVSHKVDSKREMSVWRIEFKESDLELMLSLLKEGTLRPAWFGIWNTRKYESEEPGIWNAHWYWQDFAFTDDSFTDDEIYEFFQKKYLYWASTVTHPYLIRRFAKMDEKLKSVEELQKTTEELQGKLETLEDVPTTPSITCWGDSLTAGGGWTSTLERLSGLKVYNGGTGGENARTIVGRQGGDVMTINNLTIPADTTPVTIAVRASDKGIRTEMGYTVTPLLQGGSHVNPVMIGDVEGTLRWTGSNYADQTGIWTFTRTMAGEEVKLTRPTAIRTAFDRNRNGKNEIMVIFIGQNGGYSDLDDLIRMHQRMIDHCKGKEYLVLGLSSGTQTQRAEYEAAMTKAFGRRFVSLRAYLAAPIYAEDGETITSCYGLEDAGLTPTEADIERIKVGQVPQTLLSDSVHYTSATKTVIGTMLYKKMKELGIL